MLRLFKKLIIFLFLIAALATATLTYQLLRFQHDELALPDGQTIFAIKPGDNIKSIAIQLVQQKIIEDPWLFILLARLKGLDTRVKAGEFELLAHQSPDDLLDIFTQGKSIQYSFTIIEGWTFRQMLAKIGEDAIIISTLQDKSDAEIMALVGYPEQHPEGLFFPDTYRFPKGTTDLAFLKRAYQVMQKQLQSEWNQRDPDLPLATRYEALILASIIEKETGVAFERPLIGGVFTQRLKRNMRLQTDPTIIYGLGPTFDGDIRYRDLRKNTPYNTYIHSGLTPTPIALPGLDSIRAALRPAKTKALYFVAKGDGTHQFSETLKQHNAAVQKYQRGGS
ncbi:MAG: UPF0755 protein [Gammaproteobacteria bacterium]|jgi:UPF0755 protein